MLHELRSGINRPLIIAHRGGAALRPENTMAAFSHAVGLGADAMELDIHATRDDVLVVAHDPSVERTTDGSGLVAESTFAWLRRLDAGYRFAGQCGNYPFRGKGLRIPALEELFEAFPQTPMIIDIKPDTPTIVEQFCRLIQRYDRTSHTVVGSFHESVLARFRRVCAGVPTSLGPAGVRELLTASILPVRRPRPHEACYVLVPLRHGVVPVVRPAFVRAAHRRGHFVGVWTINTQEQMRRLVAVPVDGIVTDRPDELRRLLSDPRAGRAVSHTGDQG